MKDPAILFYTSDFLTGTLTMSDEQVGKYIRLLCLQHQKRRLTEKDMIFICKSYDEDIFSKFIKNGDGRYYNQRMDIEISKREKYSESRSSNRKRPNKKEDNSDSHMNIICNSYDKHMENENENENINRHKDRISITNSENFNFDILKENKSWIESTFMNVLSSEHANVSPERLYQLTDIFINEQKLNGHPKNENDYRYHFTNWLKIQVRKKENQKERKMMP